MCRRAREVGALVLLDCYQSLGTVPIDVQALGVDMVCGGSVKWLCGGPGAAYLYVRPDLMEELEPRITGWAAHDDAVRLRDRRAALRATVRGACSTAHPRCRRCSRPPPATRSIARGRRRGRSAATRSHLTERLRTNLAARGFTQPEPCRPAEARRHADRRAAAPARTVRPSCARSEPNAASWSTTARAPACASARTSTRSSPSSTASPKSSTELRDRRTWTKHLDKVAAVLSARNDALAGPRHRSRARGGRGGVCVRARSGSSLDVAIEGASSRALDGAPPRAGACSPDAWRPCSRPRRRHAVPGAFGAWRLPDRVAPARSTARDRAGVSLRVEAPSSARARGRVSHAQAARPPERSMEEWRAREESTGRSDRRLPKRDQWR